jgi:hypothetical protein
VSPSLIHFLVVGLRSSDDVHPRTCLGRIISFFASTSEQDLVTLDQRNITQAVQNRSPAHLSDILWKYGFHHDLPLNHKGLPACDAAVCEGLRTVHAGNNAGELITRTLLLPVMDFSTWRTCTQASGHTIPGDCLHEVARRAAHLCQPSTRQTRREPSRSRPRRYPRPQVFRHERAD